MSDQVLYGAKYSRISLREPGKPGEIADGYNKPIVCAAQERERRGWIARRDQQSFIERLRNCRGKRRQLRAGRAAIVAVDEKVECIRSCPARVHQKCGGTGELIIRSGRELRG